MSDALNIINRRRLNDAYRRAIESPDLLDVIALRDKALAAQRALLPGVQAPAQPDSADADLAAWLADVAAADVAARALDAQRLALTRLVNDCDSRIAYAAADPNSLLGRLNADLAALMERVADVVERLNGAHTPREVIASGVGDVWRELDPLRGEYDKLRQAQEWTLLGRTTLIDARSKYVDDPHASDAWISNLDTAFPGWNQPDRTFRVSGDAPRRQPWPDDPIEMLVWLADSAAQPWIPTIDQSAELRAERRARLNPPPKPAKQHSDFPKHTTARGLLG